VHPAPHGRPQEPRDDRGREDPAHHAERKLETALADVEEGRSVRLVEIPVDQRIADAGADDSPGNRRDRDVQQVVGTQVVGLPGVVGCVVGGGVGRSRRVHGRAPPEEGGHDEPDEDRERHPQGLEAHAQIPDRDDRVEGELDDNAGRDEGQHDGPSLPCRHLGAVRVHEIDRLPA